MKKKKTTTLMEKWVVVKSIYNNTDYEVWENCSSEKECKEYISNNIPLREQKDFFYFKKEN